MHLYTLHTPAQRATRKPHRRLIAGPPRAAAWRKISCFLYFVCRRRLVKCLDVHRDGGRSGRRRAHVGNEHVRALRVVGGKPPVGVERADDGGVTRVPVWNAYGMQSARNSVRAAPYMLELCWNARSPRPASVLAGDLRLIRL